MNVEIRRLLPIGTVVQLKNTTRKVMIISTQIKETTSDNKEIYHDYLACLYPAGVIDSKVNYTFDDADIETIYAYGPITDEEFKIRLMAQNLTDGKNYELLNNN